MTRQIISTGTTANDGTGDTLRSAGTKINSNFSELYTLLGGDTLGQVSFEDSSLVFEGNTPDDFETRIRATEPTADNVLLLPNTSGNLVVDTATQTLTNKTLTQPNLDSAQLSRFELKDIDSSHNYNFVPGALSSNITVTLPNATVDDQLTFNDASQTLKSKTLFRPRIQQMVSDSNGEPILELDRQGTTSHIKLNNADNPTVSVSSDNANANVNIEAKGSGSVTVKKLSVGSEVVNSGGGTSGSPVVASEDITLTRNTKSTTLHLRIPDGTKEGEVRMVTNGTTGSGTVVVQFVSAAKFAQGTTVTLQPNGVAQFVWDGTKWYLVNYHSTYMTIA